MQDLLLSRNDFPGMPRVLNQSQQLGRKRVNQGIPESDATGPLDIPQVCPGPDRCPVAYETDARSGTISGPPCDPGSECTVTTGTCHSARASPAWVSWHACSRSTTRTVRASNYERILPVTTRAAASGEARSWTGVLQAAGSSSV